MTVKEFYDNCGGGYEAMAAKFPMDALIIKFLKMLEKDTNFADLGANLEAGDLQGAFASAHNLKGLVLNLNLEGLKEHVFSVTEALRAGDLERARAIFPELGSLYTAVLGAIAQL